MKMQDAQIIVAESSTIIRCGVVTVLKRLPDINVQPIEIASREGLMLYLEAHKADILIVNPQIDGWFDVSEFKRNNPHTGMRFVSLITAMVGSAQLKDYDESISLFDDMDSLTSKISALLECNESDENDQNALSYREKEIIGCIVKGMTNKEIAETLYISVHTVITHRRNISRKLQIHSTAGLTIYAIVNKLVELSEVKMDI